jgi:hypothetical protein
MNKCRCCKRKFKRGHGMLAGRCFDCRWAAIGYDLIFWYG